MTRKPTDPATAIEIVLEIVGPTFGGIAVLIALWQAISAVVEMVRLVHH